MSADSFAYRLKQLRLEKGMTQGDLAGRLGIHPGTIARWENARFQPTHIAWNDLAKALGTTSAYLRDGVITQGVDPSLYLKDVLEDVRTAEQSLDGDQWKTNRELPAIARDRISEAKHKLESARFMKINDFMTLADVLEIADAIVQTWPDAPQDKINQIFNIIKGEIIKTGKLPASDWIKSLIALAR